MENRPLAKLKFCGTSLDEDVTATVKKYVKAMGGVFDRDLGRDTACLVVGQRWSTKYNFTLDSRADIKIVHPDLIKELFDRWMSGAEPDMAKELEDGQLRAFEGLRISVTNYPEKEKALLVSVLKEQGAEYLSSLTNDCDVLVSPVFTGRKVAGAQNWKIPITHHSWIFESSKRGAAWDPQRYLLELPEEDRGKPLTPSRELSAGSTIVANPASSSLGNANSRIRPREQADTWGSVMQPSKRVASDKRPSSALSLAVVESDSLSSPNPGVFAGISFELHGYDARQKEILKRTIESHSGLFLPNPDYLVINSKSPYAPALHQGRPIITEWAIERSLHKKQCLLDDIWGKPIVQQGIDEFNGVQICLSGYTGVELLHLTRLIPMLGAVYCPTLTAERDILVATPESNKFRYAQEWGVPVTLDAWLLECAHEGRMLDFEDRHVIDGKGARAAPRKVLLNSAHSSPQKPKSARTSKRAKSVTVPPADITAARDDFEVEYEDEHLELKGKLYSELGIESEVQKRAYAETQPAVNARRRR